MIFCLLIETTRNQQGAPQRQEKMISGETLQIGRGVASKIRLYDESVAMHHATLTQSQNGKLFITAESPIKVNGVNEQNAALIAGTRIEIGPYVLTVDSATTGPYVALTLEVPQEIKLPRDFEETIAFQSTPVTLRDLKISKRKIGYRLAAWILFLFLLLPIWGNVSPELVKLQADLPVTLAGAWSPGSLAKGHSVFGVQCTTCHQKPFQPVSDEVCKGCHKVVGQHVEDKEMQDKLFHNARCTSCHVDHKGESSRMLRHDSSNCVVCHGDIKSRQVDTTVANVQDFAIDHPPFSITVHESRMAQGNIQVLPNQQIKMIKDPGLKYSHQLHLDVKGISSPEGEMVLTCQNCHHPDQSGTNFEPISMEKNCQLSGCHGLYYAEPAEGNVPHGSEREVMNRLRSFYVRWLAESEENQAECGFRGKGDATLKATITCANELAQKNAESSLFAPDIGCGECHTISRAEGGDSPWKVDTVRIAHRDLHAKSVFPHGKHASATCISCHDKMNSQDSSDIAMPRIERCRECHVGERATPGKASNSCDSCHRFHGIKE